MTQLHPAIRIDGTCEAWSVHENSIVYLLLMFLRPPPRHSFSLDLDTMVQLPARHSSIHVVLECMFLRDQLLGDILCFLHHPNDKLSRNQSSYLLHALCARSYLDMEKITCWVLLLVRSACLLLPHLHHYQLTVLPSCRFQLTNTSMINIFMEMNFAVQQGSSGDYLSRQRPDLRRSTPWPESCALVEMQLFRLTVRHIMQDNFHLRGLQLCTHILVVTGFSTHSCGLEDHTHIKLWLNDILWCP